MSCFGKKQKGQPYKESQEDNLKQEIQTLKQKNQELENIIQEYQLEKENFQNQISNLQDQNDKLIKKFAKKSQDNDNLSQQFINLRQEGDIQLQQDQENLNPHKFNSKKNEIKFYWDISSQIYKEKLKPYKEFEDKFEIGKEIQSDSYGNVFQLQILDQKNEYYKNKELTVKIFDCNNLPYDIFQNLQLAQQQINLLPKNLRKYILPTIETYSNSQDNKFYIVQPKAKHSLFFDINQRKKQNKFFNSSELQYQLGCSLLGLVTLDTLGIAHRDIKPQNLLVMDDDSIMIQVSQEIIKCQLQVKQFNIYQGTPQYWAPEHFEYFLKFQQKYGDDFYDYDEIENYNDLIKQDYSKSDLYAIGQCFLQATLLVQSVKPKLQGLQQQSIIKYLQDRQQQNKDIFTVLRNDSEQQDKVKSALERLELEEQKNLIPQLNSRFINLLEKMVEINPENRITLQDSLEELLKIQDW